MCCMSALQIQMWCLQNVKSILQECYGDAEAVTDELVDFILKPGLQVCPAGNHVPTYRVPCFLYKTKENNSCQMNALEM